MGDFLGKFKSAKQDWPTPDSLFECLDGEFSFEWDLAADSSNTKCNKYFTATDDAMTQEWEGVCWLNPPYGDKHSRLSDWVKKSYRETRKPGCVVVMLIPARTNTNWWHDYCMKAREIRFIRGRPKFGGADHGLPQPLAIIVFEPTDKSAVMLTQELTTSRAGCD